MGFLDKLLGRKKPEAGEAMQTAPEPASMPAAETPAHTHGEGEGEHRHEEDEEQGSTSREPA
jgi:hypothetical protein